MDSVSLSTMHIGLTNRIVPHALLPPTTSPVLALSHTCLLSSTRLTQHSVLFFVPEFFLVFHCIQSRSTSLHIAPIVEETRLFQARLYPIDKPYHSLLVLFHCIARLVESLVNLLSIFLLLTRSVYNLLVPSTVTGTYIFFDE